MPLKFARVCTCGKVVSNGSKCQCQITRDREIDRQRPSAHDRGYDSKWQRYRVNFLATHPVCAMCPQPATVVDHKIPHRGNHRLFWSTNNHQPLCARCHNSHKQSIERKSV
jgi:5-methylcytosine-specific restriction enzyme A